MEVVIAFVIFIAIMYYFDKKDKGEL